MKTTYFLRLRNGLYCWTYLRASIVSLTSGIMAKRLTPKKYLIVLLLLSACENNDSGRLKLTQQAVSPKNKIQIYFQIFYRKTEPYRQFGLQITEPENKTEFPAEIYPVQLKSKDYAMFSIDTDLLTYQFNVPYKKKTNTLNIFPYKNQNLQIISRCMDESCLHLRMCSYLIDTNSQTDTCTFALEFKLKEDNFVLEKILIKQKFDNNDIKIMDETCEDTDIKCNIF